MAGAIARDGAYSLMNRIDSSTAEFANSKDRPREWNRFMGGRNRTNHPFVSGYWYFFMSPPEYIFRNDALDASNWWFTTAETFTPHSSNLLKGDLPGMGGQASSFVTGREITRTFSVNFREYQNLPIFNYISMWQAAINDPHLGHSMMKGNEYIPQNYKGHAFATLCKPTFESHTALKTLGQDDIEILWYYDGVFPENNPTDSFPSDITTNDFVSLPINFSFDGYPIDGKNDDTVLSFFLDNVVGKLSMMTAESEYGLLSNGVKGGNTGGTNIVGA